MVYSPPYGDSRLSQGEKVSSEVIVSRSPFCKEERLQKALEYLNAHGAMKVKDYMEITGLSHSVAAKELCGFEHEAASGISSIGRLAGKVYVRRMEE